MSEPQPDFPAREPGVQLQQESAQGLYQKKPLLEEASPVLHKLSVLSRASLIL